MLNTILIDDEENGRNTLRNFLVRYCGHVHIVAEADSVSAAIPLIGMHRPQLVFLDINMPEQNGFALFNEIPAPDFQTIFVTAYDSYALQAIKLHALDYILKPLSIADLVKAVARAEQVCAAQQTSGNTDARLQTLPSSSLSTGKLGLPTTSGLLFVPAADVVHCMAEGSYTWFHLAGRKPLLVCKPLGFYEERLREYGFVRVHNRHLVNLAHVEQYQRGRGGMLLMSNGDEVLVSQRKKDGFLHAMDSHIMM